MDIFKSTFNISPFTLAHFYLSSPLVYSQWSTEPSWADCAAREAVIVGACNTSKPTTELIVDHSRANCCQRKA
ncbi:hypothetical protein TYRP_016926 [Tyrophagus putrescentiae]|nr:hypothetical protein TYRP_016926 [Tyrophagus putrescentiae]